MQGLFISGANTNVGKTFVACQLIKALRTSVHVRVRKPVESACARSDLGLIAKDAQLLSSACQNPEPLDKVCPFRFEQCASGEKASADMGISLSLAQLSKACQVPEKNFVVVEGAGGLYSPIASQTLNSDLAADLALPLVLVVKDELGAVGQALLCLQAAKAQKLSVLMLVLNQITPNDLDNAKAIEKYTDVAVLELKADNLAKFSEQALGLIKKTLNAS